LALCLWFCRTQALPEKLPDFRFDFLRLLWSHPHLKATVQTALPSFTKNKKLFDPNFLAITRSFVYLGTETSGPPFELLKDCSQ